MPWAWRWHERSSSTRYLRCANGGRRGQARGPWRRARRGSWKKDWGRCTGARRPTPAGCANFDESDLALAKGAAAPALGELRPERLAAGAGPVRSRRRLPAQNFLRPGKVGIVQDPDLRLALGGRQLAHGGGEVLVAHHDADARGLQKVLGVMNELL